jgi:hypothetical protein
MIRRMLRTMRMIRRAHSKLATDDGPILNALVRTRIPDDDTTRSVTRSNVNRVLDLMNWVNFDEKPIA